jgi:glycosyltransferase involved in cell wall biosynthesis
MGRVMLLSHTGEPGGAELSMVALANGLRAAADPPLVTFLSEGGAAVEARAAGHEVVVIALGEAAASVRRGRALTVRAAVSSLQCAAQVARIAIRNDVDIVHSNSLKSHLVGAVAARLAGVASLWHVREILAPPHASVAELLLMRCGSRLADGVVANSRAAAHAFDSAEDVLYPGVDLTPLAPVAPLRSAPPERLVVLSASRIARSKGQLVLLEAVRLMPPDLRPKVVVAGEALFGEEPYMAELRRAADGLDCEFIGHVSDLASLLTTAHVVVHAATTPEAFGRVLVESMAAGRPVLAASGGGVAEILDGRFYEWMVPPGDARALSAALSRIRMDWERTVQLAEEGRAVAARFDIATAAAEAAVVYARIRARREQGRRSPSRAFRVARLALLPGNNAGFPRGKASSRGIGS